MGNIVVSENVTLDGVVQDPTGEEGFARGGWFLSVGESARAAWADLELDELQSADAVLMGRRTYEFFASRWPNRSGPLADRFNSIPKYVVTSTKAALEWSNSSALRGDLVEGVVRVRDAASRDVLVYASGQLVQALVANDLVDELRLVLFPSLAGAGERLFAGSSGARPFRLTTSRLIADELVQIVYRRGA